MNTLKKSLMSLSLLLLVAAPAFASTDIEIKDNGADSDNDVKVEQSQSTEVKQENESAVSNVVGLTINTGGNTASKNTGGDSKITSGDVEAGVAIHTQVNGNEAMVDSCCDEESDANIDITGNGAKSDSKVETKKESKTKLKQLNDAQVGNVVGAYLETGDNEASKNTNGDSTIKSGDIEAGIEILTEGNANSAKVSGCCGEDSNDIEIKENGYKADTKVTVKAKTKQEAEQDNDGDAENVVGGNVDTGDNVANKQTGGKTTIKTGKVSALISLLTSFNMNWLKLK
jgi:hypothetical protein